MTPQTRAKILIVDDHEATRYSMGWALREAHFEILEAADGREAMRLVAEMPDLIILDVKLPDISGFDVCGAVKNNPMTELIPILHVSACYTSPQHRTEGLEKGADGYLIHPIEAPELVATVHALLRARDKTLEAKLAEQTLRTTFDAIADGICFVDAQGKIQQANKAMTEILQKEDFNLVGQSLAEELQQSLGANDTINHLCAGPDNQEISGKGKTYHVHVRTVDPNSPAPIGSVYCFSDVTDRKISEERIKQSMRLAEEANQAKSAFLANMSHEIRTPLGAILGFSELLKEPELRHSDRIHFVETINRNGRELGLLIDDILDLSKVEAGHLDIEKVDISPSTLLSDVVNTLSGRANEKGVHLVVTPPEFNLPRVISSDPTRLRQILFNIIGNAVKFTDEGEVRVTLDFAAQKDVQEGFLRFTIADTGTGISEADVQKLFKPFSQADASTTRKFGGTGLGLVLARKLARALGGDVVLEKSEVGRGSTFVVTVNTGVWTCQDSEEGRIFEHPAILESDQALNGVKILVAEDSPDNQILIRTILKKQGAEVEFVDNGSDAVERALSKDFDLVLLDMQMPILDGYDAAEELRSKKYKGPIVALTAHAMQGERERCLKAGCNDHLSKPFTRKRLVYIVAQYGLKQRRRGTLSDQSFSM